jgi:hypothetical protein
VDVFWLPVALPPRLVEIAPERLLDAAPEELLALELELVV